MKVAVVFPSVMYREGPTGVKSLIEGIERIGFDELDMFDHVLMGHPTETRRPPFYSPTMPIMEAFMTLSFAAAVTHRIGLGTSVLVLTQRPPALVAKQVSTLDTLSGGRTRLGVGIGWQRSEYEALEQDFSTRGARLEEAVMLMRKYWRDESVTFSGEHYSADAMAMEPKPPQGGELPVWVGGTKHAALRRIARIADGWMAMNAPGDPPLPERIATLKRYLDEAGRSFDDFGMQMSLTPDGLSRDQRKRFYVDMDMLRRRYAELRDLGFDHLSIDCVPLFQAGFRTSGALLDHLQKIYDAIRNEREV